MKKIIAVVVAVLIIVLAFLFWKPQSAAVNSLPETAVNQTAAVADDTQSIDQDLQTIEVDDASGDFTDLNKDIESL